MAAKQAQLKSTPGQLTPRWKRSLAGKLLRWFARHQRDLPWRRTADPYQIWVSEIMLQQTQVATVIPYFERFVASFPTVESLSAADEHAVLRHWEGLGYYRRARQMHRAARVVVQDHGGQFPRTLEAIQQLPGIGRYTAGAIASIAFDLPAPILEANTVRLLSRLAAFRDDPASGQGKKLLWQLAVDVLPDRSCGAFNQALMELGSQICTPRKPACDRCPISSLCAARTSGLEDSIPLLRAKPPSEAVREAAVVLWRGGRVLLRKRQPPERWAGLWDFVRFPLSARGGKPLELELLEKIAAHSGLRCDVPQRITTLKHGVTRFRITLDCYRARARGTRAKGDTATWQWVRPDKLDQLALSTTGRKLARLLTAARADR